jgi:hypothetical protein
LSQRRERGRALRLAAQAAVFLLGLAALGWAVSMALKNREQLERLGDAGAGAIAALLALSLATQTINGLIFWWTLAPVRRLRVADVLATNAVSTALAYLPFKIGAIARIVIHNRRDRVPLAQIGAWFAAVAVVMVVAFVPPVLAAVWLKRVDWLWVLVTVLGEVLVSAALIGLSRQLRGERGVERLTRVIAAVRFGAGVRLLRSRLWAHLHSAFDMLAHPAAAGGTIGLRLLDAVVQGVRFTVAARVLGVELGFAPGLVISLAYFTAGVVSPVMMGAREAGAMAIAALMLPGTRQVAEEFAGVALFVTATEAVVYLGVGTLGMLWLRPDRLLRGRTVEREGREEDLKAEVAGKAER